MTTRKKKEYSKKQSNDVRRQKARPKIIESLPGQLEREFRLALGKHNVHLNMLDMVTQSFAAILAHQPDESAYIRDCAKKMGFHSLYPNTSFASAQSYLLYSHIAYVISAGDMLCKRIRSTDSMKALKRSDEEIFKELDEGDFVTRTVALIVLAMMLPEKRTVAAVKEAAKAVQLLPAFAVVNYYRIIRNEELHAAGKAERTAVDVISALPVEGIRAQFKTVPQRMGKLSSEDALLCSKAWQSVAKWLCRHMISDTDGQAIVKKRFGNLDAERRKIAAQKFMQLDLLYSQTEINAIIAEYKW
ncbi:hypothetical protein IFT68_03760 [Oxalobacteraceae sp. CFBP 13730]|nr:hypothetical protein [Oxalobacteraceae sp. CFBP 13730]